MSKPQTEIQSSSPDGTDQKAVLAIVIEMAELVSRSGSSEDLASSAQAAVAVWEKSGCEQERQQDTLGLFLIDGLMDGWKESM